MEAATQTSQKMMGKPVRLLTSVQAKYVHNAPVMIIRNAIQVMFTCNIVSFLYIKVKAHSKLMLSQNNFLGLSK